MIRSDRTSHLFPPPLGRPEIEREMDANLGNPLQNTEIASFLAISSRNVGGEGKKGVGREGF